MNLNLGAYKISGGKLPMTWYPQSYLAKVPMTNMDMRANPARGYPGRTYRFYKGPVIFPFGHGLSYTTFAHSLANGPTSVSVSLANSHSFKNSTMLRESLRVTHTNCDGLSVGVHVDVKNTGSMDGPHTLLAYSVPPGAANSDSNKQLIGFEKVHVVAGAQQRVRIHVDVCKHLSVVDKFGIRRIPMGEHTIHVGDLKHSISVQISL